MSRSRIKKDYWDKADIYLKHFTAIFVPIIILIIGIFIKDEIATVRHQSISELVTKIIVETDPKKRAAYSQALSAYREHAVPI